MLAASLACVVVLGSWFLLSDKSNVTADAVVKNDGGDSAGRLLDAGRTSDIVGQVTRKVDCNWQDDRWYVAPGPTLREGQTIRLGKGFMELSFNSGASVVLEGPALLTVESDMCLFLHQGKASATIPSSARGFTIRTPTCQSVDLGTAFGLKVDAMGNSELHVFKGEVVAQKLDREGKTTGDQLHFDEGMASRFDRSSERSTTAIPISSGLFPRLSFPDKLPKLPHLPVTDNLVLWLSADSLVQRDDKGRVVAWGNILSGPNGGNQQSHSAWQVEEGRRPLWASDAINGHPAIRFEGHSFLVTEPLQHIGRSNHLCCLSNRPGTAGVEAP